MEQEKQYGVWVKASERLPEMEKFMHLRDDAGCLRMGNFFQDCSEVRFSVVGTEMYDGFLIKQEHFDRIEWLDQQTGVLLTKERFKAYERCVTLLRTSPIISNEGNIKAFKKLAQDCLNQLKQTKQQS